MVPSNNYRIWDVTEPREQKHVLVFKSKERGTKTKVTACAYSPDGKFIVAGRCTYVVS